VEQLFVEEFGDAINNGKISYIEGIMLDITEEKIAEICKVLNKAANKANQNFLANIAMRLEPLNGIIGFTDHCLN
jgi:DNA polymerase/3'-5' exonuclease PolX